MNITKIVIFSALHYCVATILVFSTKKSYSEYCHNLYLKYNIGVDGNCGGLKGNGSHRLICLDISVELFGKD